MGTAPMYNGILKKERIHDALNTRMSSHDEKNMRQLLSAMFPAEKHGLFGNDLQISCQETSREALSNLGQQVDQIIASRGARSEGFDAMRTAIITDLCNE